MTTLEQKYWENQENIRHNKEMENIARIEAQTRKLGAESQLRQVAISERMEPYNKAKIIVDSITGTVKTGADLMKTASSGAQTLAQLAKLI